MIDLAFRVVFVALGVLVVGAVIADLFSQVVVPRPSRARWRISRVSNQVLWRAGGFRDMAQTGVTD